MTPLDDRSQLERRAWRRRFGDRLFDLLMAGVFPLARFPKTNPPTGTRERARETWHVH